MRGTSDFICGSDRHDTLLIPPRSAPSLLYSVLRCGPTWPHSSIMAASPPSVSLILDRPDTVSLDLLCPVSRTLRTLPSCTIMPIQVQSLPTLEYFGEGLGRKSHRRLHSHHHHHYCRLALYTLLNFPFFLQSLDALSTQAFTLVPSAIFPCFPRMATLSASD